MTATTTPTTDTYTVAVAEAVREYRALRDRRANPPGTFDKAGRFGLGECYACCAGIRPPSRHFPYSEMVHGRTAVHLAHKHGVSARDVRAEARRQDKHEAAGAS